VSVKTNRSIQSLNASALTRPGYQRLMLDAQGVTFDVIVVESIDRLGRMADVARAYDQLAFLQVQPHALNLGQVTQMRVGVMGMIAPDAAD
jgi:DNA invertase Pin-like site-specific DNA recombinase